MREILIGVALLLAGCTPSGKLMNTDFKTSLLYESGNASMKGYVHAEAKQFIEFCVELDNQDDRLIHSNDQALYPAIDASLWNPEPLFDSRRAVAKDVVRFFKETRTESDEHWGKLYAEIISRANTKHSEAWGEKTIFDDPDLNGFGPWQNAWLLYEGRGEFKGAYAIAVRGTVFSNSPSVAADAWFHPVAAKSFLSQAVQFADSDLATLHSGFAHATFTVLLDDRYGILRVLNDKNLVANTRLYIVGHSQGAAMATMVHAFMHYVMRNDQQKDKAVLDLKGKNYKLKSYGFAQPKPGNYVFSSDFASITQRSDNAIVINNHIDPVPKVPFTLQAAGDLDDDFKGRTFAVKVIHFFSGLGSAMRQGIALLAEPFVKDSAKGYSYFYKYDNINPIGRDKTAGSWNFAPVGHVIFVFGTPGDPKDSFLQHHATTYRKLISEQLGP